MKTAFDKAVLLEKAIILNAMMANGSSVEKKYARKEWEKLETEVRNVISHVSNNGVLNWSSDER